MTQFEKLDLLLRECGGTIQTFQVLNNGISKSVFYAYVKERGLEQAAHPLMSIGYHFPFFGQLRKAFPAFHAGGNPFVACKVSRIYRT